MNIWKNGRYSILQKDLPVTVTLMIKNLSYIKDSIKRGCTSDALLMACDLTQPNMGVFGDPLIRTRS